MLDRADYILFALATVLGLWGLSLLWRGLKIGRDSGARHCPACRKPMQGASMKCDHCHYQSDRGKDFRVRAIHWPLTVGGTLSCLFGAATWYAAGIVTEWGYRSGTVSSVGPGWKAAGIGCIFFGLVTAAVNIVGKSSRGSRHCPKCWYDMNALPGLRCPECGHEVKQVRLLYRRRRRPLLAAVGGLIVLIGLALATVPTIRRNGVMGTLPTALLVYGFEHAPTPSGPGSANAYIAIVTELEIRAADISPRQREAMRAACHRIVATSKDLPRLAAASCWGASYDDIVEAALGRIVAALESRNPAELDAASVLARQIAFRVGWRGSLGDDGLRRISESAESIFQVLETTTSLVQDNLAMLLSMQRPLPREHVERLLEITAARPATTADILALTLRDALRTRPEVLVSALEHGSAREKLVCLMCMSLGSEYQSLAALDRDPPDESTLVSSLTALREAVPAIARSLHSTNFMSRELFPAGSPGARQVMRGLWQDLVGPRLPWVTSGLSSPQWEVREAACDAITAIAEHSDLDLTVFRPALEELAARDLESAKKALHAVDARLPSANAPQR